MVKIQLILLITSLVCAGPLAFADVQIVKAKLKPLDLNFSCDARKIKTVDECYYLGVEQLNKIGCKVKGVVTSSGFCDATEEQVAKETGIKHVKTEWVCSIPSINCKENLEELCPLNYKSVTLRNRDVLGNGRVFMHFMSYCVLDPVNGRKDPAVILPNATPVEH